MLFVQKRDGRSFSLNQDESWFYVLGSNAPTPASQRIVHSFFTDLKSRKEAKSANKMLTQFEVQTQQYGKQTYIPTWICGAESVISVDVRAHNFFPNVKQWNRSWQWSFIQQGRCLAKQTQLLESIKIENHKGLRFSWGEEKTTRHCGLTCHQPPLVEVHRSPWSHQPYCGGRNLRFLKVHVASLPFLTLSYQIHNYPFFLSQKQEEETIVDLHDVYLSVLTSWTPLGFRIL